MTSHREQNGAMAGRVRPVARQVGRGLAGALIGADPAPAWRSPWLRRATCAMLAVTTLLAAAVSVFSLRKVGVGLFGRLGLARGVRLAGATTVYRSATGHGSGVIVHSLQWVLPGGALAAAVVVALLVVAPLPLAARYPLLGWRIGWLGLLLVPLTGMSWSGGWPWNPVQILAVLVVFCVAGVRQPRAVLGWIWALTLIPWWLDLAHAGHPGWLVATVGTVAFTAAAVATDAVASRRRTQQALASQAEQTELEQARRAVLEERAKIARELHDVVAHHMSLIAVRAETAPYRLAGLPDPIAAEFGSLSAAAREALADMRRLLGVLRHDQPAARAPQPQLCDLPALIDTARQAGVAVALSTPPALGQVPAGVGVCAYRIVQESLTNASRHAPGAPVTITVDHNRAAVLLRVANGPTTAPAGASGGGGRGAAGVNGRSGAADGASATDGRGAGSASGRDGAAEASTTDGRGAGGHGHGQGLAGMRERVALLGGALTAGPSPDGGFIVSATLPLTQAA
jgi:signal transduction histidine kinase